MAEDKKNAEDLGAYLVFIDESGFLLIPSVRRTWGLRGKTPIHRHHHQREKVSVISALTVSPERRRIGLYFRCLADANFDNVEVAGFLRHLLKHLRGFVIVIWDNARCHKGDAMRRCRPMRPSSTRMRVCGTRRALLWLTDNPQELSETLSDVLSSFSQSKLRWCFHQSELPPFLP